jgi:spore coat polysaccharide biosynthesis protein SpsF
MKNKVLAFVICRLNSQRLRNKMIKKINNKRIIDIVITRLKQTKMIDEIILLTSDKKIDNKFIDIAKNHKIKIFRGSEHNVLNRINSSLRKINFNYKFIVRANGDCPLLMPNIIDADIRKFIKSNHDLYSPFYYNKKPFGFSFVIFKRHTLFKIEKQTKKKKYLEHIENYCFDNNDNFQILKDNITKLSKYYCPKLKLVLDTKDDFQKIKYYFNKLKNIPIKKQAFRAIRLFKKNNE